MVKVLRINNLTIFLFDFSRVFPVIFFPLGLIIVYKFPHLFIKKPPSFTQFIYYKRLLLFVNKSFVLRRFQENYVSLQLKTIKHTMQMYWLAWGIMTPSAAGAAGAAGTF